MIHDFGHGFHAEGAEIRVFIPERGVPLFRLDFAKPTTRLLHISYSYSRQGQPIQSDVEADCFRRDFVVGLPVQRSVAVQRQTPKTESPVVTPPVLAGCRRYVYSAASAMHNILGRTSCAAPVGAYGGRPYIE